MHTTYFDEDDILVIRLSDKPIVREVSQNWNTHISYAEDGSAVEVVMLEAARPRGIPAGNTTCTDSLNKKFGALKNSTSVLRLVTKVRLALLAHQTSMQLLE